MTLRVLNVLAFAASAAAIGTAVTASSAHAAGWTTAFLAVLTGTFACGLTLDLLLRR